METRQEDDIFRRSAEIHKFFRTTTSDKATVSQFLQDVDSEMANYQAEINRLKTAILMAENKRDRLKQAAELYKPLISPIYVMPPEILTAIFTFVCEKHVFSSRHPLAAIKLSMVYGRWKDIVFSTPSLWASIAIDFDNGTRDVHGINQITMLFLERSKAAPLRLSLVLPGGKGDINEGTETLLRSLTDHCECWEHLSLENITRVRFPLSIFEPVCGRVPLLKSLSLVKAEGDTSSWIRPFTCFNDCPALSTIRISPDLFEFGQQGIDLPWAQFETVRLHSAHNVDAFPLLSLFTEVKFLELNSIGGLDEDGNDYSSHLVLSQLETLFIDYATGQGNFDSVLKHTTVGGLSSLKICSHWGLMQDG